MKPESRHVGSETASQRERVTDVFSSTLASEPSFEFDFSNLRDLELRDSRRRKTDRNATANKIKNTSTLPQTRKDVLREHQRVGESIIYRKYKKKTDFFVAAFSRSGPCCDWLSHSFLVCFFSLFVEFHFFLVLFVFWFAATFIKCVFLNSPLHCCFFNFCLLRFLICCCVFGLCFRSRFALCRRVHLVCRQYAPMGHHPGLKERQHYTALAKRLNLVP